MKFDVPMNPEEYADPVCEPMECRACMQIITPVLKKRVVLSHQDAWVAGTSFQIYERIRCCPKCGERDI